MNLHSSDIREGHKKDQNASLSLYVWKRLCKIAINYFGYKTLQVFLFHLCWVTYFGSFWGLIPFSMLSIFKVRFIVFLCFFNSCRIYSNACSFILKIGNLCLLTIFDSLANGLSALIFLKSFTYLYFQFHWFMLLYYFNDYCPPAFFF